MCNAYFGLSQAIVISRFSLRGWEEVRLAMRSRACCNHVGASAVLCVCLIISCFCIISQLSLLQMLGVPILVIFRRVEGIKVLVWVLTHESNCIPAHLVGLFQHCEVRSDSLLTFV